MLVLLISIRLLTGGTQKIIAKAIIDKKSGYILVLKGNQEYLKEVGQRKRNGHAANNSALLEKIALNLLNSDGSKCISIKNKGLVAALDNQF